MPENSGLVKDWLGEFLEKNWPAFGGRPWDRDDQDCRQSWSTWMTALIEINAKRGETELAADLTALRRDGQILDSPAARLACIVAEIKSIRAANPVSMAQNERSAAQDASRDCVHCGGQGLVLIERNPPGTVAAHCVCPMGRWLRGRTQQDMIRRIPDYGDSLADRIDQAAVALREMSELGWAFHWYPSEGQFRIHQCRAGAERPSRELSNRCRELRAPIYDLLNHKIEPDEVLSMDDFRDQDGQFQWRALAAELARRMLPPPVIPSPTWNGEVH